MLRILAQDRRHILIPDQLVSKALRASPEVPLRVDLDVYGGLLRSICPITEHLLRASCIRDQQLQNSGTLDVHASLAKTAKGFDAHGGMVGVGQVGLQNHP